jgi:hypothetical protein
MIISRHFHNFITILYYGQKFDAIFRLISKRILLLAMMVFLKKSVPTHGPNPNPRRSNSFIYRLLLFIALCFFVCVYVSRMWSISSSVTLVICDKTLKIKLTIKKETNKKVCVILIDWRRSRNVSLFYNSPRSWNRKTQFLYQYAQIPFSTMINGFFIWSRSQISISFCFILFWVYICDWLLSKLGFNTNSTDY